MQQRTVGQPVLLILTVAVLAAFTGCSNSTAPPATAPLSAANVNLIFVASPDLAFQGSGDVNPSTANLTSQGLQRSLLMGTFLKSKVLGAKNVTGIYALEPMTHLQTANNYPDMAALESIQHFALLNQITLPGMTTTWDPVPGNSYPINVSYAAYAAGPLPSGVAMPLVPCPGCQGLDFTDQDGDNETLVTGIIVANIPGFYVFSAPWETLSGLLANVNKLQSYNLTLPASYAGPNSVYAISITPSGSASLETFDSNLQPLSTYPTLPAPALTGVPCGVQTPFNHAATGGIGGAAIPAEANTNETVYIIRHANAHPTEAWDDGNYVCAGQWRALDLPNTLPAALRGKPSPNLVYSIDPSQIAPVGLSVVGASFYSYIRPSLTVAPYAIANNLPYGLASDFELIAQNPPVPATEASNFFFTGGKFSNQTVLLGWESQHITNLIGALVMSYYPNGGGPTVPTTWLPADDYDTIWTVTLDANGNLAVDNANCEGINSDSLPKTCPNF